MVTHWWQKFDWWLAGASGGLLFIGLAMIASSTLGTTQPFARNQLLFAFVGIVIFIFISRIDYHLFLEWSIWEYAAVGAMLLLVAVLGRVSHGAESWLQVGPFTIQPSEFAKLGLVLVIARMYQLAWEQHWPVWKLLGIIGALAAPVLLLILLQPDFGTASVLMVMTVAAAWISPVSKKMLVGFLVALMLIGALGWQHLAPYQKQRVMTFLNPGSNPLGSGYNVLQSQIAVGSGEWTGLGWGRGTQSHLNFLPEHHTDFIFASLSEEFGFLGAFGVIVLYGILLWRSSLLAWGAKDRQTAVLAIGISLIIAFQALVNMGMNVGLAPVTGVPLPLVSYGGSSLFTTMLAIALLESVALHRPSSRQ